MRIIARFSTVPEAHLAAARLRAAGIEPFLQDELTVSFDWFKSQALGGIKLVVADEEEVKQNWEKLKLKEGKKSVLEGVPKSLPALVKASRIQDKVKGVGFDWEEPHQVWDKVQEELQELQVEVASGNPEKIEAEFGDVLFSLINYARFLKINPEDALERTNKKFIKRFQYLEGKAAELGKPLVDMTLAEMDVFWEEAKKL
jgi:XTP/dITP diphosphohydrolase